MKFLLFLSFFPGFLVALTVHEAAHALVSKWLGDRYAEKQGRISLNPMRHLSALGTLMLFVAGFGWGKPVPVNLYNYKHPKLYYLLSSLAGPASNILLCLLSLTLIYGLNFICQTEPGQTNLSPAGYVTYSLAWMFLYSLLYINVILAVVNLIPIPPLDGSKIWPCLIPKMRPVFSGKAMWIWIVILVIMMRGDAMGKIVEPAITFVQSLMPAMLHKQVLLPPKFPAEMKAPEDASWVYYDSTKDDNSEPNSFMTYFELDKPYPATDYRTHFVENMARFGWSKSDNNNFNKWKISDPKDTGEGPRKLTLEEVWKKENSQFYMSITYYTDPNGQNPEELMSAEYIYTIMNPISTQ